MLILALSVLPPIGCNPSLADNLLKHSAHTLAVGGQQLIALVEGARGGQCVAIFHRPKENVGTRVLRGERIFLPSHIFLNQKSEFGIGVVNSYCVTFVYNDKKYLTLCG